MNNKNCNTNDYMFDTNTKHRNNDLGNHKESTQHETKKGEGNGPKNS